LPGKWVELNLDDSDGDLIPDYVDGYQFSHQADFNTSENDQFVPLLLDLAGLQNSDDAQIRFLYDDNDPLLGVSRFDDPDDPNLVGPSEGVQSP